MRRATLALVAAHLAGCAGALGVYVPGSGNKAGTYRTATPLGNGLARIEEHDYAIGRDGPGIALGAKLGWSWASLGDRDLEPGLAGEAHADLGYSKGRFGALASVALGGDRASSGDTEASFNGMSVGAIAQAIAIPRIAVHAGLHRLLFGKVALGESSADAVGWRFGAGVDLTAYRGSKNEFILRVDWRHSRSSEVTLDGVDARWSGDALLGQLVWVSTP